MSGTATRDFSSADIVAEIAALGRRFSRLNLMANHPRMVGADGSLLIVPIALAAMIMAVMMAGPMNRTTSPCARRAAE